MASKTSKTHKGVRLTLGGAPNTWHQIAGFGLAHPTIPRPISEEDVAFVTGADCLAVVDITEAEADKATEYYNEARAESLGGIRDAQKHGAATEAEVEQINDESEAVKKEIS